jgi:integrase
MRLCSCNETGQSSSTLRGLRLFFDFHQFPGDTLDEQGRYFLEKTREDIQWGTMLIMQFLVHHRERVEAGEFASGSLKQYWQAIRKFTDAFMDLRAAIDWKRIIEAMPAVENVADDRIPNQDELRGLVKYRDPRIKALVCTLCSCGMRVGSVEFLKVKHITKKTRAEYLRWKRQEEIEKSPDHTSKIIIKPEDEEKIIAATIILHGEKKRKRRNTDYISFITPEAYFAIQEWLDLRRRYGEEITSESYIMRKLFRVSHIKRADDPMAAAAAVDYDDDIVQGGGVKDIDAAHPTKMTRHSVSCLLGRAMYETGLRDTLEEGKTRHQIKAAHFASKFFKTRASMYMNALNVEKLLDHRVGLDPNYWRPIEMELLADYIRAAPALTINDNNIATLHEQQEALEKKQEEKDKQLEVLQKQLEELKANVHELMSANLVHEMNASLQGKSDRDVADELASGLESAIGEVEARAAKGEKLPIVVGEGDGVLYFTREEVMQLKSLVNKRRQQKQQQEKKKD